MTTTKPVVAVLGTGAMGGAMACNVAARGLPVRVWNRTWERADGLRDVARVAGTVAEAVEGADVVITMLWDVAAVAEVMEEARGHIGEQSVWLQQSTVGLEGSARLVELAEDLHVTYVDAPVLGTKKPAEDGQLVILASGPVQARALVQPVLDAIGSRTQWIGEKQEASRLKLVVNAWVATCIEGIADSLALARDLGLEPTLFLEAVAGGAVDSPYIQSKGPAMLSRSFQPSFTLSGALKDVDLILDAAERSGTDLGLMPGVRNHLARAVEAGHGDLDMAATYLEH